jgi:hypothetical protein
LPSKSECGFLVRWMGWREDILRGGGEEEEERGGVGARGEK